VRCPAVAFDAVALVDLPVSAQPANVQEQIAKLIAAKIRIAFMLRVYFRMCRPSFRAVHE
jgi:hypothetical protein